MAAAAEILGALARLGMAGGARAEPLAGGVSSDIWKVELPSGPVCVKRALPRLKVAALWEAPVERNGYEYEWLRAAGEIAPGCAPRLLGRGDDLFVMEYLAPASYPVWKERLRSGFADPAFAARVGSTLGAIHAATAGKPEVAAAFPTDEIFYAIRLEPYLVATSSKHPDLEGKLLDIVRTTASNHLCLVHGDVSPKNILAGPAGPVFLDAECAWYGDPAFDLAFCLNHLLLKCAWVPQASQDFLASFAVLLDSYRRKISWEDPGGLEKRTATLLPGLLLARVDGKSPVEYITEESRKSRVRAVARRLLQQAPSTLEEVRRAWRESLT